jgi:EAL domain-containing protein (putative c-di-GMP-specific phosphodiesterase class I)/ActR/RegA family two-component response regulator
VGEHTSRITPILLNGDTGEQPLATPLRVLLVDDEPLILRVFARALTRAGMVALTATTGVAALETLDRAEVDVVVTDVSMPEMDGVALLAGVRQRDPDVPIILVTGNPSVETAMKAVEYGALRYLCKPISDADLTEVVVTAGRLSRLARLKRAALGEIGVAGRQLGDLHSLGVRFGVALEKLWIAYQPIISWHDRRLVAYEALCRSDEPLLRGPLELLEAAERLGRVHELGRAIRRAAITRLPELAPDCLLFLNLHPRDLQDPDLIDPASPVSQLAGRIVLEVTERRALDGMDVLALVGQLRQVGYRLAVDDLGAGYAGLSSFAQIEPTVVKLDMSLIRGVDGSPVKQRIIRGMVKLCRDMGAEVVVEGVETVGERDALVACGCGWMQGYLFGRPDRQPRRWPEDPGA